MKKRTKLLCISLLMTAFGTLAFSCKDNDSGNDSGNGGNGNSSVVVGGEVLGGAENEVQIFGADDWHIPVNAQVDFTQGVYAQVGDDTFTVSVDFSKVNLTAQGEYSISYSFENTVIEKRVFVYGDISFTDSTPSVTLAYSDAYELMSAGFVAKDSFGNDLDVQLLSADGLVNKDGTLNIGTYSAQFIVVDKAGQSKKLTRSVTVTAESAPTVSSAIVYDVADESLIIPLQNANITGISVDGKLATLEFVTITKDSLILDGAWVYSLCSINESVQIRLISATGWAQSTLTVKDEKAVQYDDSAIVAFADKCYACDSEVALPEITLTNRRQRVTPIYRFVKGSNSTEAENAFTFTKSGIYKLQVDLRGDILEYDIETYFDLGLKDGMVFNLEQGFDLTYNGNYQVVGYALTDKTEQTLYAEYRDGSKTFTMTAFKDAFTRLNVSQKYRLIATALNGSATISQAVDCYIVKKAGQSVLSEKADGDNGNMYAWNSSKTALNYIYKEVSGRRGVFQWTPLSTGNINNESSILSFGSSYIAQMKKGTYLTFDVYTDSAFAPFFYTNSAWFGLWDSVAGGTYFATKVDKGSRTDITSYTAPVFAKVYDENGVQLTKGSFSAGSFNNKWVTVEICLPEDMGYPSADGKYNYNGLAIYPSGNANGTLVGKNIYLSNVRISDSSLMNDTTSNPLVPDNADSNEGTGVIVDLWLGKDEEIF